MSQLKMEKVMFDLTYFHNSEQMSTIFSTLHWHVCSSFFRHSSWASRCILEHLFLILLVFSNGDWHEHFHWILRGENFNLPYIEIKPLEDNIVSFNLCNKLSIFQRRKSHDIDAYARRVSRKSRAPFVLSIITFVFSAEWHADFHWILRGEYFNLCYIEKMNDNSRASIYGRNQASIYGRNHQSFKKYQTINAYDHCVSRKSWSQVWRALYLF